MHRTQVIFEERQYNILKQLARKERKSISGILREIVDSYVQKTGVFSVRKIEGVAEDREFYGRDHDRVLYGDR